MMGWSFYCDPSRVRNYAEEKAEIGRICSHENDDMKNEPLQLSKVGSTWYAAVKKIPKGKNALGDTQYVHNEDGSYVFAAVLLVSYQEGCFGYKAMEETMGPVEARAPMSLIKKLSPLQKPKDEDDSRFWAKRWRAKCQAWADLPNYKTGDVIALGAPIELTDGTKIKTVRKDTYYYRGRNMPVYVDVDTGQKWRLTRAQLMGSRLDQPAIAQGSSVLAEFAARKRKAG